MGLIIRKALLEGHIIFAFQLEGVLSSNKDKSYPLVLKDSICIKTETHNTSFTNSITAINKPLKQVLCVTIPIQIFKKSYPGALLRF